MDIAALQRVGGIIFDNERGAVILEPRGARRPARRLVQPHGRVVRQRDAAARRREQVLRAVGVGRATRRCEVALGVVGGRHRSRRRVLVKAVRGIAAVDIVMTGPGVGVVGARVLDDPAGRIVAEAERLVVRGAAKVVAEAGEPGGIVVAVAGAAAVAQRQRCAAAQIVIGVGR